MAGTRPPLAQQVLDNIKAAGVDYDEVVDLLEKEGVAKFEASWGELIDSVNDQIKTASA